MSGIDIPAALDLVGTVLSILGGILAVVPAFREARYKAVTDGIKSWIARRGAAPAAPAPQPNPVEAADDDPAAVAARQQKELAALQTSMRDADQSLRSLRNSSVRYLQVGIILLTLGLFISLPAKWVATFNDPCAVQAKCRGDR